MNTKTHQYTKTADNSYRESNVVHLKAGFTLIEMMVAMGIVFIMTAVSMANYSRFGQKTELENAAYELALNIRQAQFFGINRSERFGETFDDPQPYGVYFNLDDGKEEGVSSSSFIMFVDQDKAGTSNYRLFDTSDNTDDGTEVCRSNLSNECVDVLSFNKNNYIDDICVGDNKNNCESIKGLVPPGFDRALHISFKRPDPDAVIRIDVNETEYSFARITMKSPIPDIPEQTVSVGAAGLIAIN